MQRFVLMFCAVVVLCCSGWADKLTVDHVTVSGTITATQPCSSNCTETISLNFLFVPGYEDPFFTTYGYILPGSFNETYSGFLGSASVVGGGDFHIVEGFGYWYICCGAGTEVDLVWGFETPDIFNPANPVGLSFYACNVQACQDALGARWTIHEIGYYPEEPPLGDGLTGTVVITETTVAEPTSLLMLVVGLNAIACTRRYGVRGTR
jgi:hypothetical protein